jgi:hypothetical protein
MPIMTGGQEEALPWVKRHTTTTGAHFWEVGKPLAFVVSRHHIVVANVRCECGGSPLHFRVGSTCTVPNLHTQRDLPRRSSKREQAQLQ